jgi:hypothetical protein
MWTNLFCLTLFLEGTIPKILGVVSFLLILGETSVTDKERKSGLASSRYVYWYTLHSIVLVHIA